MSIRRYAQRLLNPFRGVMNIIEYESAEAVTIDGIHWDIYVRDADLVKELPNSSHIQTTEIRYGSWSAEKGLKRGSIYPSEDFTYLEHLGSMVFDELLEHHQNIPFPLQDHLELWLLDKQYQPLALLNSAVAMDDIELDCPTDWRAGLECRNTFQSNIFDDIDTGDFRTDSAGCYLTDYINSLRCDSHCAQWFLRDPNKPMATGLVGINIQDQLVNREISDQSFNKYMLNLHDHDEQHQQLIKDFLNWQAPWLLLLQDLSDADREHFEQQARQRALTLDKQFNLYPKVIDQTQINAARVEARFRSHNQQQNQQEDFLHTEFIELHPSPTE